MDKNEITIKKLDLNTLQETTDELCFDNIDLFKEYYYKNYPDITNGKVFNYKNEKTIISGIIDNIFLTIIIY